MPAYPTRQEIREKLEDMVSKSIEARGLVQDLVVLTYEDGFRDGKVAAYFELEGK